MKKIFLLLLLLAFIFGAYEYYFFNIRPQKIMAVCNQVAQDKLRVDPMTTYGASFKKCLMEHGLKKFPEKETFQDFLSNIF